MSIEHNLSLVREEIQNACRRSGREPGSVTLLAVSKTKPVSDLQEALRCGVRSFGENKVQELKDKAAVLPEVKDWHMIGHLQTNKVKYLPGIVSMVHSLDRLELAETLEQQFSKHDLRIPVLCELNMAGEESKFGLAPSEALDFIQALSRFPHLIPKGLMTVAPFTEIPEENRVYFRALRELLHSINHSLRLSMDTLSMGMTGDYAVAIEEGATIVRVGSGIFGERNYANH